MHRIVAIGGCSNSGKSTLARQLSDQFPYETEIVALDNHVQSTEVIPKVRDRIDWELPESIDWRGIYQTILSSKAEVVIVEGFLIFWNKSLRRLFDVKIFLDIDYDTFMQRRRHETRWGSEPEWYVQHVWDSYLKFGQLEEPSDDFYIIKGTKLNAAPLASTIIADLEQM